MLRSAVRLSPNFIIPIFGTSRNKNDEIKAKQPSSDSLETGFDRVKKMFTKDEFDEVSVELHHVVQSSLCGAFAGACLGGLVRSRDAYMYFIENNQATIYKSTNEAKKKLQDYVTVAFAKGAYQWGWKVGIFTGIFSLIATTMSVYQGNTSLIEYVTAGALTGAIYKANLGPAATLVGAGLGAVLSAIGGVVIIGILKVSGTKMEDIRKALYKIKEARVEQYRQAVEKASTIKNDELTRHHDLLLEEKGESKIEELT